MKEAFLRPLLLGKPCCWGSFAGHSHEAIVVEEAIVLERVWPADIFLSEATVVNKTFMEVLPGEATVTERGASHTGRALHEATVLGIFDDHGDDEESDDGFDAFYEQMLV